jgi:type IX secretion system PorP/SprF family membrane protein
MKIQAAISIPMLTKIVVQSKKVIAQQTPVLNHYYYNPYIINPALTGQSKETREFFICRHQWIGSPGSPETQSLTINGPLADKRIGLGLNLNNDVSNIMTIDLRWELL